MNVRSLAPFLLISLSFLGLFGCNDPVSDRAPLLAQDCKVSQDQLGAFMVPLPLDANVKVVVDEKFIKDDKSGKDEPSAIAYAVSVWNAFSNRSLGRSIFTLVPKGTGGTIPERADDCSFEGGTDDTFYVVKEERAEHWKALGLGSNNPGVTVRCRRDSKLLKQVVMINTNLARPEQLASIVLHELGHALGLNHSCLGEAARSDYATCNGMANEHPYHKAIMFPFLRIGAGKDSSEIKDQLKSNDMERAYCLYHQS